MDNTKFTVLLAKPEFLKPPEIAKVLSAARQIPYQDAIHLVKNCWGFVAQDLEEKPAQDLAARFGEAGLPALVVPQAALLDLPPAAHVSSLVLAPENLTFVESPEKSEAVSWSRLVLVACGVFDLRTFKTVTIKTGPSGTQKLMTMGAYMMGIPFKFGGRSKTTEKKVENSEILMFVDFVLKDPAARFRIDCQHFDFKFLKERMLYNVMGNVRLVLGDVVKSAPQAWVSLGTRVLLESKPIRDMHYESLEDLERESRWLLALESLKPR